jgi:Flp pilus assembly protein TadD
MSSELRSRALLGALLLAVVLRAEYLRELLASPFGRNVVLDGVFYEQAARLILAGQPLAADPGCFRAPLYPFFLAGIRAFTDSSLAPRLIQMLLGLVTVAIVRGIALRTHGPRVANVAGFVAAGYGMFVYHEGEILGVSVGVMLNALATLLLLEAGRRGSARWAAGGGLALGLTAVTHATALVLAPIAFFWLLWLGRAEPRGPLAARLAALTVAVTLPVSLATVRNWMATGDFVLVATQGGINFYVGNNPEADGRTSVVPGRVESAYLADGRYRDMFEVAAERIAERETGRDLSPSEINSFWMDRAGRWMRENPDRAARLMLSKAALFWTGIENSNNRDFRDQAERFTPILRVFLLQLAFLMPFAVLGLVRARGRPRESALVIGFVAAYFVAIAAFFVCSRFRQPVIALMIPYAASGAVAAYDSVRRFGADARGAAGTVLLLAGLFVVTNERVLDRMGVVDLTLPNAPFHRYNLAILREQDGDPEGAVTEYRAAAKIHPDDPRIPMNLGRTLLRLGRPDEAMPELDRAAAADPGFAVQANGIAGSWAIGQARWDLAIDRFRRILEIEPGHPDARFALGSALLSAGRAEEAASELERLLRDGSPREAAVRRNLGLAYRAMGREADAARELEAARRLGAAVPPAPVPSP